MYRTAHLNEILFFKAGFIGRRLTFVGWNAQMLVGWGTTLRGLILGFWLEPSHNYISRLCLWLIGFAGKVIGVGFFAALASDKHADRWRVTWVRCAKADGFDVSSLQFVDRPGSQVKHVTASQWCKARASMWFLCVQPWPPRGHLSSRASLADMEKPLIL